MKRYIVLFLFVLFGYQQPVLAKNEQLGSLRISFDFNRAKQDYANNQFAVWIEDLDGKLVKNIFATKFTAKGGWKYRPESLPTWTQKSNISKLTQKEVDAISGATPKAQRLVYKWNVDDSKDNFLPAGKYKYFVEVNYYWGAAAIFSGIIDIGDSANNNTAKVKYSTRILHAVFNIAQKKAPFYNDLAELTADYLRITDHQKGAYETYQKR